MTVSSCWPFVLVGNHITFLSALSPVPLHSFTLSSLFWHLPSVPPPFVCLTLSYLAFCWVCTSSQNFHTLSPPHHSAPMHLCPHGRTVPVPGSGLLALLHWLWALSNIQGHLFSCPHSSVSSGVPSHWPCLPFGAAFPFALLGQNSLK